MTLLGPQRKLLYAAIASGAANQLFAIASAALGAYLVGRAITGATAAELRPLLVGVVVLVIPRVALPWLESVLAHIVAFGVLVTFRDRVHAAFERLSPGYLIKRRSGDLGSAVIGDIEKLELFFAHTLSPLVVAITVPFISVLALGFFHWSLPLVVIPALVLVASVPAWLQRRAEVQGREVREATAEVSSEVVDGVQGLREVVTFGYGRRHLALLDRAGAGLLAAQVRHGKRSGIERAAIDAVVTLAMLVVLALSAALVASGAMNPAVFPAAVILAAFTFQPVTLLAEEAKELNLVAAAGDRVLAILNTPPPVIDHVTDAPAGPLPATISFEDVSFRYAPDLADAITDVTFAVAPAETVALVGHSGAGKSTTAHLLMRFWDVNEGTVRVGGHDVRQIPQHTLRELVTFVPQDVYLFHTSVANNIRLGRPDATDEAVEHAARAALADEFIAALPDGYHTLVGERGAQLSGGQRQRIALARALLKDSPILVMDEPVSNLDAQSEHELTTAMAAARAGRTVVVIAHRLSTIRTADRLVVFDRGRVVQHGTHADLLNTDGTYATLIASQAHRDGRQGVGGPGAGEQGAGR
jgi:thiol reductant ABC exporter CydC subunit